LFSNLPTTGVYGWGLAWSRSTDPRRFLSINPIGGVSPNDSELDFNWVYGPGSITSMTISDLSMGANFSDQNEAKNVFTLWRINGEGVVSSHFGRIIIN
ncbi:hypothetical protein ACFL5V_10660, partial [Fibrobacterota bacterium]